MHCSERATRKPSHLTRRPASRRGAAQHSYTSKWASACHVAASVLHNLPIFGPCILVSPCHDDVVQFIDSAEAHPSTFEQSSNRCAFSRSSPSCSLFCCTDVCDRVLHCPGPCALTWGRPTGSSSAHCTILPTLDFLGHRRKQLAAQNLGEHLGRCVRAEDPRNVFCQKEGYWGFSCEVVAAGGGHDAQLPQTRRLRPSRP